MEFVEYLKNKNPELYKKSQELDETYRVNKVRRNMEQRKRKTKIEKQRRRILSITLSAILLAGATVSTIDAYANEKVGTLAIELSEQEKQIVIDEILQRHQELLNHMAEQSRVADIISQQMNHLTVSRGATRTASPVTMKAGVDIDLKRHDFSNDKIAYVKANDLGVALSHITMPVDHQEYLYLLTKEKGLDFLKTLAVIKHESGFKADAQGINRNSDGSVKSLDQGYMQINSNNRRWLTGATGLPDAPFNPYINMEWGTLILSDLYRQLSDRGLSGDELDNAVWSAYNMGMGGYSKHGVRWVYVDKVREAYDSIK